MTDTEKLMDDLIRNAMRPIKFKCVECGENEALREGELCEDCFVDCDREEEG